MRCFPPSIYMMFDHSTIAVSSYTMRVSMASVLAIFMLSGCLPPSKLQAFRAEREEQVKLLETTLHTQSNELNGAHQSDSSDVKTPYLAGKSIPLAREFRLPRPLQKGVSTTLLFSEKRVSLALAADRISLATGIPVLIAQDVYIDPEQLLPKSLKSPTQSSIPIAIPIPTNWNQSTNSIAPSLPSAGGRSSDGLNAGNAQNPYSFEMPQISAPLSQILDLIASRLNIRWMFDDAEQHIRFYRLQTKSWQTPFSPSELSFSTQFESSGSSSNQANNLQIRPAAFPLKHEASKLNELSALAASVDSLMTRAGSLHLNQSSGTLTLTDTSDVIAAANKVIESEIALLSKVVTLKVRTIQVKTDDKQHAGLDLNAAIQRIISGLPHVNASYASPMSVLGNAGAQVGLSVLSGQANGSTLLIKALSQLGEVHSSTEITLPTRNRKPVSYNVTKTFSYVAATTPATATLAGGSGTPGITTAQDQVGLKLLFFPNVSNKDSVMLTMSLEQSLLENIEPFSSGTGQNIQTVQLPNKAAENSSGEIPLRHGQTLVLTGLDKRSDQFDRRRLGEGLVGLLGGTQSIQTERSTTLVLITAFVQTWE